MLAVQYAAGTGSGEAAENGPANSRLCPVCGVASKFWLQCTKLTLYARMYGKPGEGIPTA